MIFIMTTALLAGIWFSYKDAKVIRYNDREEGFKWRRFPFGWVGGWLFGGAVLSMFFWAFMHDEGSDHVPVENRIASLADGSSVHGSFFLGSGSVDEEPVFFYYMYTNEGYKLKHVPASITSIQEFSGTPYMVRYCNDPSTMPEWVHWPLPDGGSDPDCSGYYLEKVIFYVPQGSIKNNYILDAQ